MDCTHYSFLVVWQSSSSKRRDRGVKPGCGGLGQRFSAQRRSLRNSNFLPPEPQDIRRRGIDCPSCKEQEAAAADGDDGSSGTIMIIGIVVGGVLFLIAIVAVAFSRGTAPDTADMDKPRAMANVVYEAPNDDTNGYLTVAASRS